MSAQDDRETSVPVRQRSVVLTEDEAEAVEWCLERGRRELRGLGFPDMHRNADLVDEALAKLKAAR
jgi:hypothetical protein